MGFDAAPRLCGRSGKQGAVNDASESRGEAPLLEGLEGVSTGLWAHKASSLVPATVCSGRINLLLFFTRNCSDGFPDQGRYRIGPGNVDGMAAGDFLQRRTGAPGHLALRHR